MHWVVQFCTFKSHRVEGDWSGRLPSFAERQNGSRFGVTSICSDKDFQCWHPRVVNCCETVPRKYKLFDLVKGLLMSCRPRWEFLITVLIGQFHEDCCVCGEIQQKCSSISHQSQKTSDLHGIFWYRPPCDLVRF